jgi:large subunit ribosomal protein L21
MFAVIKTGGKQYKVREGDILRVEKLNANEGDTVELETLMISDENGNIQVGNLGKKVIAKVLKHGKGEKIIVFKYMPKKHWQRKKGHRQWFTEIKIEKIES